MCKLFIACKTISTFISHIVQIRCSSFKATVTEYKKSQVIYFCKLLCLSRCTRRSRAFVGSVQSLRFCRRCIVAALLQLLLSLRFCSCCCRHAFVAAVVAVLLQLLLLPRFCSLYIYCHRAFVAAVVAALLQLLLSPRFCSCCCHRAFLATVVAALQKLPQSLQMYIRHFLFTEKNQIFVTVIIVVMP